MVGCLKDDPSPSSRNARNKQPAATHGWLRSFPGGRGAARPAARECAPLRSGRTVCKDRDRYGWTVVQQRVHKLSFIVPANYSRILLNIAILMSQNLSIFCPQKFDV